MERFVGSGELDGDQMKAEGNRVLPRFGPLGRVMTYVLLVDACGTVNVYRPVGNPKRKV
jgi:hypothetical protein